MAGICEKQAGEFVYETAFDVDGFLLMSDRRYENGRDQSGAIIGSSGCSGGSCLEYLVSGYTYLEADVTTYPRMTAPRTDFEVGTGRYRYALEARNGENCKTYDRIRRHNPHIQRLERENPALLEGKCLVARRVDTFQSLYGYEHQFSEPAFRLSDDLVGNKIGSRVVDLSTGREMAVNVRLSAHKPGVQNHHVGSCGPAFTVRVAKILRPVESLGGERQ